MGFKRALEVPDIIVPNSVHLAIDLDVRANVLQKRAKFAPRLGISRHTKIIESAVLYKCSINLT